MCTGVGPSSGAWKVYQWPHVQKRVTFPLQQLSTAGHVSASGGAWRAHSSPPLGLWPARSCEGLVHTITAVWANDGNTLSSQSPASHSPALTVFSSSTIFPWPWWWWVDKDAPTSGGTLSLILGPLAGCGSQHWLIAHFRKKFLWLRLKVV